MRFILPLTAVLNASKCVSKGDPRYYLEGFHVTKKAVEATNGHYLYRAAFKDFSYPDYLPEWRLDFDLPDSMIIKMKQQIKKPAVKSGCEFVVFEIDGSEVIATTIDQFGGKIGCFLGAVVDAGFPDADKVIPSGEVKQNEPVGFNSSYLKKLNEVSEGRTGSVKMTTYGKDKPALFEITGGFNQYYDAVFVLMPIRI